MRTTHPGRSQDDRGGPTGLNADQDAGGGSVPDVERTEPIGFGYEYTDVGRGALSPVTGDYPPGDTSR